MTMCGTPHLCCPLWWKQPRAHTSSSGRYEDLQGASLLKFQRHRNSRCRLASISKTFAHKLIPEILLPWLPWSYKTEALLGRSSLFFSTKASLFLGRKQNYPLSPNWPESQPCINKNFLTLASDVSSFSWGFYLLKIHLLLFKFTCSLRQTFEFLKWNHVSKISLREK